MGGPPVIIGGIAIMFLLFLLYATFGKFPSDREREAWIFGVLIAGALFALLLVVPQFS